LRKLWLFFACWLLVAGSFAQDRQASFQIFWNQFRTAVLSGDKVRVANLTHFPFETRGPTDNDPVRRYQRKAFIGLYDGLLKQPIYFLEGGKSISKTMRSVIEEKVEIRDRDVLTDNFARIEDFEFKRLNGHWRFTRAYTEEP